jgi:malate permease and related proteins
MASFLLLLVCLSLGVLVARFGAPPRELHKHLNWWVLNVAFPATVLELIPKLQFDASLILLPLSMWLIFGCAWMLFRTVGVRMGWSPGTIGALIIMGGFCNTSFVGLPLIEALRGQSALSYAALTDQLGSFLCLSTGGALVITLYSPRHDKSQGMLKRILSFPPFIALLTACVIKLFGGLPTMAHTVLARIGNSLAPIALFSVGLQLRMRLSAHEVGPLTAGLLWKLALAPAMIFALTSFFYPHSQTQMVAVLQSAMAPMVSAAILCEQHDLDPSLANMLLGIGLLVSFVTVPLWNLVV